MLLFSISFVISVLFGDVETAKIASFCVTGRKISLYFPSKKSSVFFCQNEGYLPLLFHKMLEGLKKAVAKYAFRFYSASDRSYSDRITTLLELDRCCLNVLGNVGFGISSVCNAINISFPNVRLYGANTADAMAFIEQCHY